MVSQDGIQIIALGNVQKRIFKTNEGQELLIHSLDSYNYLRLQPENSLFFKCDNLQKQIISIQNEQLKHGKDGDDFGNHNTFDTVYNILIS